ncbi:uncharacterized protein B0P05DRAFT_550569 [Gilbertella persicaria]|uniref:uncharacterized protein n=1 Tax=Gilbertella persicaria TaxID=101096 RepID=UPI00221E7E36|nr:uncharacterized protein B0P05DRAFT_550569 [Gilbertella persicaria]KAI8070651.1 hypothetical protein B0P05DRAFT_550569 [Gilbertella persicaria]
MVSFLHTLVPALVLLQLTLALRVIENCKPGYVALTYDDGPNIYTSALVDLLKQENVKATFFVNGDNFLQLEDSTEAQNAVKKAHRAQHQIASHTWSHQDLTSIIGTRQFDYEIKKLESVLQSIIHVNHPTPYGATNDKVNKRLGSMGYDIALWSTDTKDYETHDLSTEMDNIRSSFSRKNKNKGYVILSHDVSNLFQTISSIGFLGI